MTRAVAATTDQTMSLIHSAERNDATPLPIVPLKLSSSWWNVVVALVHSCRSRHAAEGVGEAASFWLPRPALLLVSQYSHGRCPNESGAPSAPS